VLASVVSAAAFNFFHLPPTGRFTIADNRNWVALLTFLTVGLVASTIAEVARARALEAEERRRDADLAAELARVLLGGAELPLAVSVAARRIAEALDAPSAAIELVGDSGAERAGPSGAIPLSGEAGVIGWLVLPAGAAGSRRDSLGRIVSALESILAAALGRERLQREVVETASLRRSDELKTALLRSVSHDLRTPVTGILTAATALGSPGLEPEERAEVQAGIVADAQRLDRLIRNLLDLSRLEAGIAEPRRTWCSIDEVLREAVDHVTSNGRSAFAFAIDRDLPLVRADAMQLERAFAPGPSATGCSCASSTAARGSPPPSRSGSSRRSTKPRERLGPTAARASGWPSPRASSRPTAGASWSSPCPGRARASRSSSRSSRALRVHDRTGRPHAHPRLR
jgi:two-component system, OmpR family, sensor histidine kinase KdpD